LSPVVAVPVSTESRSSWATNVVLAPLEVDPACVLAERRFSNEYAVARGERRRHREPDRAQVHPASVRPPPAPRRPSRLAETYAAAASRNAE